MSFEDFKAFVGLSPCKEGKALEIVQVPSKSPEEFCKKLYLLILFARPLFIKR